MTLNIENFLNLIDNMTLLELNELVKILEKKFNINYNLNLNESVSSPSVDSKTKDICSLYLNSVGNNKISIIKFIRDSNSLGLKEAKELVDSCPVLIKNNIDIKSGIEIKNKLESLGAIIEIK